MAAPTVTLDTPNAVRLGNSEFGVLSGVVAVTSYDTAHPAVTAIAGQFRPGGLLRVVAGGASTGGYAINYDHTSSSFKAYAANTSGSALLEAVISANVGSFDFVAVGQMGS